MTEEEKVAMPAQYPVDETEQSEQVVAEVLDEQRRAASMERLVLFGAVGTVITFGFYLLLYFQSGAWQVLAEVGGVVLTAMCLASARWLIRRGKLDAAGYWMLLAVVAIFGVGESVWANETLNNTVGPILLVILMGVVVRPRRWGIWLITAALYAVYVWLINRFEPLPRYDTSQSTVLHIYDWVVSGLLALAALWQIVRAYRRITTIRTRLLVASVTVALLPVAVISVGAAVGGMQSNQQRVISQLESVATLKEAEINTWTQRLQAELDGILIEEDMVPLVGWVVPESTFPTLRQESHARLQSRFRWLIEQRRLFEELFLLDLNGQVIVSSDSIQEGKFHNDQVYFQEGLQGTYVHPPFYSPSLGRISVVTVQPVVDEKGTVLAVLAGRTSLAALDKIMLERAGLGETGETYLVGRNHDLLTTTGGEAVGMAVHTASLDRALEAHTNGSGLYKGYQGVPVVGVYHWLPELQVVLVAEQDQAEAFRETYMALGSIAGVALAAVLIAVLVSLLVTRSIASPLARLSETAARIAAGNLELTAKVEQEDEIGALARAFNRMTGQLRDLVTGLEKQVAERTRQLQEANYDLQRRAIQLEASAQVGRAIASILNVDGLLAEVVNLIRDRFGFYHAGIFLLDESGEWAVLRQATGEAGQRMLARQHQLAVGGQSIVGWVTGNRQPRVALDVGTDAVHFKNPDLPHTRSEMALPLVVGDRLLGALDVQSTEEAAFDREDVAILSLMADQVAVAIENALKFSQEAAILEATSPLYRASRGIALATSLDDVLMAIVDHVAGPYVDRCTINLFTYPTEDQELAWLEAAAVWDHASDAPNLPGTRYPLDAESLERVRQRGMEPLVANDLQTAVADERLGDAMHLILTESLQLRAVLFLPLVAAGRLVGLLMVASRQSHTWTEAELRTFRSLSAQVASAVENARLFQETQARAAREQALNQMTAHLARSIDIDTVLQTAVRELGQLLHMDEVSVHMALPQRLSPANGDGDGKVNRA